MKTLSEISREVDKFLKEINEEITRRNRIAPSVVFGIGALLQPLLVPLFICQVISELRTESQVQPGSLRNYTIERLNNERSELLKLRRICGFVGDVEFVIERLNNLKTT